MNRPFFIAITLPNRNKKITLINSVIFFRLLTNCPERAIYYFYILKFKKKKKKATGKPIFDIRLACALFAKINSNVQTYADEFIFAKSELISQPLPACRHFCLHAEKITLINSVIFYILSIFICPYDTSVNPIFLYSDIAFTLSLTTSSLKRFASLYLSNK